MGNLYPYLTSPSVWIVLAAAAIFYSFGLISRSRSMRKLREEVFNLEKELVRRDAMELESMTTSNKDITQKD